MFAFHMQPLSSSRHDALDSRQHTLGANNNNGLITRSTSRFAIPNSFVSGDPGDWGYGMWQDSEVQDENLLSLRRLEDLRNQSYTAITYTGSTYLRPPGISKTLRVQIEDHHLAAEEMARMRRPPMRNYMPQRGQEDDQSALNTADASEQGSAVAESATSISSAAATSAPIPTENSTSGPTNNINNRIPSTSSSAAVTMSSSAGTGGVGSGSGSGGAGAGGVSIGSAMDVDSAAPRMAPAVHDSSVATEDHISAISMVRQSTENGNTDSEVHDGPHQQEVDLDAAIPVAEDDSYGDEYDDEEYQQGFVVDEETSALHLDPVSANSATVIVISDDELDAPASNPTFISVDSDDDAEMDMDISDDSLAYVSAN